MRVINDILTVLGTTNGGGRWYLWWSGMFGNLTIFAAMVVFYRRHICQVHRCPRIGRHPAADTKGMQHLVCQHHHPELGPGFKLHASHLLARSSSHV